MPTDGMDAAAVPVPDAGDERGPFMHGEGCPDEPTGRLTDQCNCGQREAVNKLLVPDAGDDTLREQLKEALKEHRRNGRHEVWETVCGCGWGGLSDPIASFQEHQLDALLPLIREYIAAAVQAERERVALQRSNESACAGERFAYEAEANDDRR